MALSREQITQYARTAGFTGNDLNIAVAVAYAESGGDPKSHNSTPPDDSYGLWQINMYKDLGPSRRKWFGIASNSELYDPARNAAAAYKVFKASGWKAWTTYTRGTYKKFMTGGSNASIGTGGGDTVDDAVDATTVADTGQSDSSGGLFGIPDAISSFSSTLFNGVANIGGILAALVLIVLGIVILLREQLPISKLKKVIS